jgi:fumarate hydratase class II
LAYGTDRVFCRNTVLRIRHSAYVVLLIAVVFCFWRNIYDKFFSELLPETPLCTIVMFNDFLNGSTMNKTRVEIDGHGKVHVPCDKYWGAQTQRSLTYFSIGTDMMPIELIHAYGIVKKAVALVNCEHGLLTKAQCKLIEKAAEEVATGVLDEHFPLRVWMTGSGTQTNMNVNEVIANRASELAGNPLGSHDPIHPNDHVNLLQSTNDTFPSAMHMAVAAQTQNHLLPNVRRLRDGLCEKSKEWKAIIKIGRTHLQDATPLTLGQEFSGYVYMLDDGMARIEHALQGIYCLTLGGTAVGTGMNTYPQFSEHACKKIAELTGLPFTTTPNAFAAQGAHDALVAMSGALRGLSVSLLKIANDIRLLASGPRSGLGELILPENEPGSSFMPGKVNPTQCEAMAMVTTQVMGNDAAVGIAGAGGMLEMNVYKPLMINSLLQSIRILGDSCGNFDQYLVQGMQANETKIQTHLDNSLMLVTALSPALGYRKATAVAQHAHEHNITLKAACQALGYLDEAQFDHLVDPKKMIGPSDS